MNYILKGKRGLIMGVANDKSLAWGIAQSCKQYGAELAFSYQNDILLKRIQPLTQTINSDMLIQCDVCDGESLIKLFDYIAKTWGKLDFLVHSIAFADKDELKGKYVNTTRKNFLNTMDISCFSFVNIAKHAVNIMNSGGSILTMTYYGAEKVIPNYNVMGVAKAALEASVRYVAADLGDEQIRVNAISAGPVRTLAASGISDFRSSLKWAEDNSPLKRNTTLDDVGKTAVYLLSELSSGVTGEIIHVDNGYNIMGMKMLSIES